MRASLTERTIRSIPLNGYLWDTKQRGLYARRLKRGVYFGVFYRYRNRQRFYSIGQYKNPYTIQQARHEALKVLAKVVQKGIDPQAEKERDRHRGTIKTLSQEYFTYIRAHKAERTSRDYEVRLTRHFIKKFGDYTPDQITKRDIKRLHTLLSDTPYEANRAVAVIQAFFSWCIEQGYVSGVNPATQKKLRYKEKKRRRFYSDQELSRMGKALQELEDEGENPYAINAIRLLIFTGARPSDILYNGNDPKRWLRWEHIDTEHRLLRPPGRKRNEDMPILLNSYAIDVIHKLEALRLAHSSLVFPGRIGGRPLKNINKLWGEVKARAKLKDARIYDLRHTFGSAGGEAGKSLPVVGSLLGHKQAMTTERYVHLSNDALQQANEEIGNRLGKAMQGKLDQR